MPATAQIATDQPDATPAIVLIGRADGKSRGSWFAREHLNDAKSAAGLTGMQLVVTRTGALQELARRVPKGRIFASGKAFAPLIQSSVYDALLPHATTPKAAAKLSVVANAETGDAPSSKPTGTKPGAAKEKLPPDWAHIVVGSTVLAFSPEDEAWFDSVVTQTLPDGLFELKWRDYPDEPTFQRRRHQLALKFPEGNSTTAGA